MSSLTWKQRDAWIAVFDILGFADLAAKSDSEFRRALLTSKLEDLLAVLDDPLVKQHGNLEIQVISDTMLLFASDVRPESYPWLMQLCKSLIERSITCRLPVRGAISIGKAFTSEVPPIFIGPAFVEAYRYCEDQDWIGLLLTPAAVVTLRKAGLEPSRHGFVAGQIPMRKCDSEGLLAYRLQREGATSFDSPFIAPLREMQQQAPSEGARAKYERTIEFLIKNYQKLPPRGPSF
jgi:hypothetical protein